MQALAEAAAHLAGFMVAIAAVCACLALSALSLYIVAMFLREGYKEIKRIKW